MNYLKEELNSLIAEAAGTFVLVFLGCGAIIVNNLYGNAIGHIGISMAFGIVVMALIYSIGNVSGAHMNPAVTIGFIFAKRIKIKKAIPYIIFQILGAILASTLHRFAFPASETLGATLPAVPFMFAFITEIVLTFILMFVIINVSSGHMEKGIMAGVAIGGTVFLGALIGGPLTGASMNPARSIGPALLSMNLQSLGLYIVGPIIGAILASPTCRFIQGKQCSHLNKEEN